jgi:predicted transcriptional regulator of viral defense system
MWERLLDVAGTQRGYVTPTDAEAVGVNPVELRKMAARGRLDHVTYGVYRFHAFPRAAHDELLEAVLWSGGRGVVSHESALDLLELGDVNPNRIHITVPTGYRPRRSGGQLYRVHHEDLPSDGVEWVAQIPVVTAAKAIAQAAAAGTDPRLVEQAVRTARRRRLITHTQEEQLRQPTNGRTMVAAR